MAHREYYEHTQRHFHHLHLRRLVAVRQNIDFVEYLGAVLVVLLNGPLFAFNTIGEEYGWRGYMNQKMEPRLGTVGTCIVVGIIWGVWHAPLTIEGHNFGTDYPGYPYMGIIAMCVMCTFEGMILMWLTKKTNSIYPAAIMHAMNNMGGMVVGNLFLAGLSEDTVFTPAQGLIAQIPQCVICAVFLGSMMREKGKAKFSRQHNGNKKSNSQNPTDNTDNRDTTSDIS